MFRLVLPLVLAFVLGCNAFQPEPPRAFEPKPLPWEELPTAPDDLPTVVLEGHPTAGVYVADKLAGTVLRLHRGSGEVLDVLSAELDRPMDIILHEGVFYVATLGPNAGAILRFHAQTHEQLAPLMLSGDLVVEPAAILIRAGELFVLGKGSQSVVILDLQTGALHAELEGMVQPHDMRMGPDGLLYVSHEGEHRVQVWNPDTASLVRELIPAAEIERPSGLAFHDGDLLVADLIGDRITRFDPVTGDAKKELALVGRPMALEVEGDLVYVSTIDGVLRYSADGALLDVFAKTEPGGLRDPRGLLVVSP